MTTDARDIWKLLHELEESLPLKNNKAETILGPLRKIEQPDDDPFIFLTGNPIKLENATISNIDLRLNKSKESPSGFLVLTIEDACLTLPQIKQKYHDLHIYQTPRGRSLDEVTSYSASRKWGQLNFSFKVRDPKCLSSISFDPTN